MKRKFIRNVWVVLLVVFPVVLSAQDAGRPKVSLENSVVFSDFEGLNLTAGATASWRRHCFYTHLVFAQGLGVLGGYRFLALPEPNKLIPFCFLEASYLFVPQNNKFFSQFVGMGLSFRVAGRFSVWGKMGLGNHFLIERSQFSLNHTLAIGGRYELF